MILTKGLLIRPEVKHIDKRYSDIIVCLSESNGNWWDCVVVKGNETYPVGGYNVSVHADDLRNGILHTVIEDNKKKDTSD